MTKQEAITAMEQGHKVTHRYFEPHEWVRLNDVKVNYIMEDGAMIHPSIFWKDRHGVAAWETDWEIWQAPTPQPEQYSTAKEAKPDLHTPNSLPRFTLVKYEGEAYVLDNLKASKPTLTKNGDRGQRVGKEITKETLLQVIEYPAGLAFNALAKWTTAPTVQEEAPEGFTLTQDGETLTFFDISEGSAMTEYENAKEPVETETFFDWCKNSYPYKDEEGNSPIENGNLSPNYEAPEGMEGHTPGEMIFRDATLLGIGEDNIALCCYGNAKADAARIVECWNGYPTLLKENKELKDKVEVNYNKFQDLGDLYSIVKEKNQQQAKDIQELKEALDMVTRVFIYSNKKKFGAPEKIKATELAVKVLLKNGITTIGQTFETKP